jgi:HEAT repeat protein
MGCHSPSAVVTLMELMEDSADEVRNWATFSLGVSTVHDSPAIREAFRRRLADSFEDAREEAIWGLAKRKDRQGLQLLLRRLEDDSWVQGDQCAARDILETRPGEELPFDKLREGIRALASQPL